MVSRNLRESSSSQVFRLMTLPSTRSRHVLLALYCHQACKITKKECCELRYSLIFFRILPLTIITQHQQNV